MSWIALLAFAPALLPLAGCSREREDWEKMKTASVTEVGKPAPDFALKDLRGTEHRLSDYISQGRIVVLEWFNPDCPDVQKHHVTHKTMNDLCAEMMEEKVVIFAINSGAPGMQGSGVERNKAAKLEYGMRYPILLDESGDVGKLYKAKRTPQMFIVARDGTLLYSGAIDDEPDPDLLGKINYVRVALQQYLQGRTVSVKRTKPYGCRIKYGSRE